MLFTKSFGVSPICRSPVKVYELCGALMSVAVIVMPKSASPVQVPFEKVRLPSNPPEPEPKLRIDVFAGTKSSSFGVFAQTATLGGQEKDLNVRKEVESPRKVIGKFVAIPTEAEQPASGQTWE